MADKSGYEIRADLLKLANEVINSNNCQLSTKYFEDKLKAEQSGKELPDYPAKELQISSDEVIGLANKFNDFVSDSRKI